MNLTIIICTFDRHEELHKCLQSIVDSNIPDNIDVLVIDNCPSKNCKSVVEQFSTIIVNLRYESVSTASLSLARNAGFQAARTDYVAYVDDDALINEQWVNQLLKTLPFEFEAFGGPYTYHSNQDLPVWYPKETLEFGLTLSTGTLPKNKYLSGTNMVFKTSLLKQLGGFDENFGMSGTKQSYGEETELQIRVRKLGIDIYFDRNLIVSHLAAEYKLNLKWLLLTLYLNGVGHPTSKNFHGIVNVIFKLLASCLMAPFIFLFHFILQNLPFSYSLYKSIKRPLFFAGCFTSLFLCK